MARPLPVAFTGECGGCGLFLETFYGEVGAAFLAWWLGLALVSPGHGGAGSGVLRRKSHWEQPRDDTLVLSSSDQAHRTGDPLGEVCDLAGALQT